jgi:dCMP deaminase
MSSTIPYQHDSTSASRSDSSGSTRPWDADSDEEAAEGLMYRQHLFKNDPTYAQICSETLRRLAHKLGADAVFSSTSHSEPSTSSSLSEPNRSSSTPHTPIQETVVVPSSQSSSSSPTSQDLSKKALQLSHNVTKHKPQFYMQLALSAALNSKDPKTQVGCVLVDSTRRIISVGYNSFPYGIDTDSREQADEMMAEWKDHMMIHAEANAIHHCNEPARLKGATAYVTLFPCSHCAKALIHAQVASVIYWSFRRVAEHLQQKDPLILRKMDTYFCAEDMFRKAGIPVVPFASTRSPYDPTAHVRLDNIVRTVRKQVMLYWSLKQREKETPLVHWPSTEVADGLDGSKNVRDTTPLPPRQSSSSSGFPLSAANLGQREYKKRTRTDNAVVTQGKDREGEHRPRKDQKTEISSEPSETTEEDNSVMNRA